MKDPKKETQKLLEAIVKAIQDKKGNEIVSLDLHDVHESISDYFIICHGDSNRQVGAIAESIEEQVKKELNDRPTAVEGTQHQEWILIDYVDIVVHVFQRDMRQRYNLEDLWSDAPVVRHEELNKIV